MPTQQSDKRKDIFISYSRKQLLFASKLYQHLSNRGYNVWFDQNDIPLAVDFLNEIERGIRQSHYFLFLLSPDSAGSVYCMKEIDFALEYGKRIVPLHCVPTQEAEMQDLQSIIARLNWINFTNSTDDNYTEILDKLCQLLQSSHEHSRLHTELICKSIEWKTNFYSDRFLLTGSLRRNAEKWLEKALKDTTMEISQPTGFLCHYICESRKKAANGATDVFISYHPAEKELYHEIRSKLISKGINCWENESDDELHVATEALLEGIESAEKIVFIACGDLLQSDEFKKLYTHADQLNKRIIFLVRDKNSKQPDGIDTSDARFVPFYQQNDTGFSKLLNELNSEKNYHATHRNLLVQALRWERNNRQESLLLRGEQLSTAQAWLASATTKKNNNAPASTVAFIRESASVNAAFSCELFLVTCAEDLDFARKLCLELSLNNRSAYIGSEKTSELDPKELTRCDNFLFLLSDASLASESCHFYLEEAKKHGKRIILAIDSKLERSKIPDELKHCLSVTFSENNDDFQIVLGELLNLLSFDRAYIVSHTRWLNAAELWISEQQSNDLLLRGKALSEALLWLKNAESENTQPSPTPLQKDFILKSQVVEQEELELEQKREFYLKELELENQNLKQSEEQIGLVESLTENQNAPVLLPEISELFLRNETFHELIHHSKAAEQNDTSCVVIEEDEGCMASIVLDRVKHQLRSNGFMCLECSIQEVESAPFAPLARMAAELAADLLRNDVELRELKQRLELALNGNGYVLTDIMPHLELILGKQPEVTDLDPVRARQRLKYTFAAFMNQISSDQPVFFLVKGLHFVNESLQDLFSFLLSSGSGINRFFFVGSCLSSMPQINGIIQGFRAQSAITKLNIHNLSKQELHTSFSELFQISTFSSAGLIDIIHEKTDGNPALVQELLKEMYLRKELFWNPDKRSWNWNMSAVENFHIIKDVEERARITIEKLSPEQNQILSVAACLGMQFPHYLLSTIFKKTFSQPITDLIELVQERMLIPNTGALQLYPSSINVDFNEESQLQFRFASNHLRKAVIDSSNPDNLKVIRIHIGRQFLRKLKDSLTGEMVYNAATYINEAGDLLRGSKIRLAAARCNLMAGELALQSSAHQTALYYFTKGLEYLRSFENFWEKEYDLSFNLHILQAKANFFCGNFETASNEMELLITKANSLKDKAACYIACCNALQSNGKAKESLSYAKEGLQLLGVTFPETEEAYTQETTEMIELLACEETLKQLENIAPAEEKNLLIGELYRATVISIYFVESHHLTWICCRNLQHALTNGHSQGMRQSMAWFSMILLMLGNRELSFQYAQLATDQSAKNTDSMLAKGQTAMIAWGMSLSWKYPFSKTEETLKKAFHSCQNNGDPQYASYVLIVSYISQLMQAGDLPKLLKSCINWRDHCEHFAPLELGQAKIRVAKLQELMGIEQSEQVDPEKIIAEYEAANNHTDVCESLLEMARISLIFNQYEDAMMYSKRAEPMINSGAAGSLLLNLLFQHVYACACAHIYKDRMVNGQELMAHQYETKGMELLEKLKTWAEYNPDNFEPYYLLAKAEWASVKDEEEHAIPLYLKVALHKREFDYPLLRAMAFEGLARYSSQKGYAVALTHAEEAIRMYAGCGALGKAKQLEVWITDSASIDQPVSYSKGLKKVNENAIIKAMLSLARCENRDLLAEKTLELIAELCKSPKIALLQTNGDQKFTVVAGFEKGTMNAISTEAFNPEILRRAMTITAEQDGFSITEGNGSSVHSTAWVQVINKNERGKIVLYAEPGKQQFSDVQKKILSILGEQYAHLSVI
ncbi:MAG TPA: TIR domain-containing protein [Fluviicola sp.]|nr:TIR domain-containing protein [Fluviicola sp.]